MEHLYPGKGLDVSTFDNRLILQKSIYLTQLMRFDLGYRFSWYVHGPYSPDLTETAYTYNNNRSFYDGEARFGLTDKGKRKADFVKQLIDKKGELFLSLPIPAWLELLASIHYLKKIAYLPSVSITMDNIEQMLIDYGKSNFSTQDIGHAWNSLDAIGLIDNKLLPEEMLQ